MFQYTDLCISWQMCIFVASKKKKKKKALVLERAQDNACAYSILVCLGVCVVVRV